MEQKAYDLKQFYQTHHDRITEKRFNSPYIIRRTIHREMYEVILEEVSAGMTVLDAGCGEGTLSILIAKKGVRVIAFDYSLPNIEAAVLNAKAEGVLGENLIFFVGDSENIATKNAIFDLAISNHVLEHLPDFDRGLKEVERVAFKRAAIAVPTCMSLYSLVQLGGGAYWRISIRNFLATPIGLIRVILAWMFGQEGVNEGYAGNKQNIHVYRFPWAVLNHIDKTQMRVIKIKPQGLGVPFIPIFVRIPFLRRMLKYCGLGTLFLLERRC